MTAKNEKTLMLCIGIPLVLFLAYLFARETLAANYGEELSVIVVDSHKGSRGNTNISVRFKDDYYSLRISGSAYNYHTYGIGEYVNVKYYAPLDFMVWAYEPVTRTNTILLILLSVALIYRYRSLRKKN